MGEMNTVSDIPSAVTLLRSYYDSGKTRPVSWRFVQLRALRCMLMENVAEWEGALAADLAKNPTEAYVTEISVLVTEIDYVLKRLRSWVKPQRVAVPLAVMPARATTVCEPLGAVLIIAPWNYPLQLAIMPMIGALAAGNVIALKPSEFAPATADLLSLLLPRYLDRQAMRVVSGGVEEATALLAQRFDHIFYTGNARVARTVMGAAAKNLTPVTLELGGKSPVYLDGTSELRAVARRIVWAKFMNAGQTCVAPDYLLATADVIRKLIPFLQLAITEFYGSDPAVSASYGRIINDTHFARLLAFLQNQNVVIGGQTNAKNRYIAPTVLVDVDRASPVMNEEIFGPILPLIAVQSAEEAIAIINAAEKPLALYLFSESRQVRQQFLQHTSSGAISFGSPTVHLAIPNLPFGGVGESGMGAYRAKRTFLLFSHQKAVMNKPLKPDTLKMIYPPFTAKKERFIRWLLKKLP